MRFIEVIQAETLEPVFVRTEAIEFMVRQKDDLCISLNSGKELLTSDSYTDMVSKIYKSLNEQPLIQKVGQWTMTKDLFIKLGEGKNYKETFHAFHYGANGQFMDEYISKHRKYDEQINSDLRKILIFARELEPAEYTKAAMQAEKFRDT